MASSQSTRFDHGISAIDTGYGRPLQCASHLIVAGGRAACVDTGGNDSAPLLLDAPCRHDLDTGDVDRNSSRSILSHDVVPNAQGLGVWRDRSRKAR